MVVMDPNLVAVFDILDDRLGKQTIHLLVSAPCGFVESNLTGVVVKKGPEDGICIRGEGRQHVSFIEVKDYISTKVFRPFP